MKISSVLLAILMALLIFVGCGTAQEKEQNQEQPPSVVDPGGKDDPEEPDDTTGGAEALSDAGFQKGFGIMGLNSAIDGASIKTTIKIGRSDPVWRIGQWGSRYDLNEPEEKIVNAEKLIVSDRSKKVELNIATGGLTLSLDATKEYDTRENSRVMWAHLLIEQEFGSFKNYRLDTFESLVATLDFNVTKAEKGAIETGETANTLPAQFLQYFYVVNYNRDSPGFGSFLWFGLAYLDTRYEVTTLSYSQDTAGGNAGNYIYCLGADTVMGNEPFAVGKEYKIDFDILPYISDALEKAAENGFMMNTQLGDCVLTGMNLGWEVPGAWDVSATFHNLSLTGNFKNQEEIK